MVKQNEKNEGHRINHMGGNPFRKKIQSKGLEMRRRGMGELSGTLSCKRNVDHGFKCSSRID